CVRCRASPGRRVRLFPRPGHKLSRRSDAWEDGPVTATILDGKATLATIKSELKQRIAVLAERGIVRGQGSVRVGDDPGSKWYVAAKHRDCAEVGIASIQRELP